MKLRDIFIGNQDVATSVTSSTSIKPYQNNCKINAKIRHTKIGIQSYTTSASPL